MMEHVTTHLSIWLLRKFYVLFHKTFDRAQTKERSPRRPIAANVATQVTEWTILEKISLMGCKLSSLKAPGSETTVAHSLLESSIFPLSAPLLPSFFSLG